VAVTRFLLAVFLILGVQEFTHSQGKDEMFTIYLARHAEKASVAEDPTDPPLSACGERRAKSLAITLKDVKLERVYSTPYARTRDTGLPAAAGHGLEVEDYDPANLEAFADALLENKQNALVVGHSNTTAVLAGLISGEAGEEFDEDEYDRLYLVTVCGDQKQVILLHQTFRCDG
jgi:broad specificity phosphatase PhoE